jgi:multidrug efflux pump subunit AcrB
MKITDLSIRKHITIFVLMGAVILMGVISYTQLPREAAPDIEIPYVMVYAPYFGTSPEDMETLVSRKLEKQLKGLADLEEMSSSSSEGSSTIFLEFKPDVEMSDALQEVRDAVELAKPELPQDVKDDLVVYELSIEDWPIQQVVLSGDYDPVLLKKTAEDLQEELEQIKGVLSVDLTGGIELEVSVDVDPDRLRFYGLALQDVMDAIFFENITLPGGELSLGTYEYQVRVPGEFNDVEEISSILLNLAVDSPIYLRDVATVRLAPKDPDTYSRLNSSDAVTLSVKKRSGENLIMIADAVRTTVADMMHTFPERTEITITNDQSIYVRDMVRELENNILSGLILVVAVLFLFLGFTNSLFVGIAIPFSMLISFVVLRFLDITLNMVVLFSLILALGMLVDNAIVIVENIFRHRTEGFEREEAARKGTAQVGGAVVASTLTTLCAFTPLVFWPGIMGEFMKYLPITLIITLTASLAVALIFNPVLCSRFMRIPKSKGPKERFGDRLFKFGLRTYEPTIRWALRHRGLVLGGSFLLLVVVFMLFGKFNAGVELFPDVDPTYAFVRVEAPSGTRIELSDSYSRNIEKRVNEVPDLEAYVTEVGAGGGGGFGGSGGAPPHLSLLSMEFIPKEERSRNSRLSLEDLRSELHDFTGANVYVEKVEEGPSTGAPVNIEISGHDFAVLGDLAEKVRAEIEDIEGMVDLKDDFDRGRPEIQIRPDLEKAARLGLRREDVASTVRTAIRGQDISKYRIGEDEYDIVVRYAGMSRRSVEDLEELTIFYEGEDIPITAFAEVSYEPGLGAISRIDSKRVVSITADVAAGYNSNAVLAQVRERLSDFPLPTGYRMDFTGENEDQEEAQAFLSDALGVAVILIFLVLVTQFTSVTVPFVIMSTVLLSFIGVLLGLTVMRMPFGIIMTGVGVISLVGIVVNNAIVLLDYILKLRRAGRERIEAVVEAGKTRFRPVILTAITTILGLIPLTTGFSIDFGRLIARDFERAVVIGGESSQWWGPMGVAVIWGLAVATFLTLIVVPVMYASIEPTIGFMWRLVVRTIGRLFGYRGPAKVRVAGAQRTNG